MNIKLFTDGSYNINTPDKTFGACVALDMDDNPIFAQRYISTKSYMVSMKNAGGELMAAGYGCIAICNYLKRLLGLNEISEVDGTIHVYYDHSGVEKLMTGDIPRKQGTVTYCMLMERVKEMCPKVTFEYHHVKSHSGDTWNEVVDCLTRGIVDLRIKEVLVDDYNN